MKNPRILLVWLLVMGATAQDESSVAPKPMADETYDSLFRKSPFRRYLSLTEGMVLTGLAKLPDGVRATVLNRENNQTFVVSRKTNPQGWKIVRIEGGPRPEDMLVTIGSASQEVTVRFDPELVDPEKIRRRRRRKASPGTIPEEWKREPWVEKLSDDVLKKIELLPRIKQESFREDFADYLEENPEANSGKRKNRAEEIIKVIQEKNRGD